MKTYEDVVDKRIKKLHQMASTTRTGEIQQLRSLIDREVDGLNDALSNIKNQMSEHKKEINQKHTNHNSELTAKTENLYDSVKRLTDRISALESDNRDLKQQIKVLQAAIAGNNGPGNEFLISEIKELKNKLKRVESKPVIVNQAPSKNSAEVNEAVQTVKSNLGLEADELKKIGIKANLEEGESLESDYVDKKFRKSFISGVYQTWAGTQKSKAGMPKFTITLYGYGFKTKEVANKFYKFNLQDARSEETHSQEKITMADEGWVFEKPVNTLIVKNKEMIIGKSEAVFLIKTNCYVINASFVDDSLSISDIKTLVTFLVKKI